MTSPDYVPPLPYPAQGRNPGDAGHINDHNQLAAAYAKLQGLINDLAQIQGNHALVNQVNLLGTEIAHAAQQGHIHSEAEVQGLIAQLNNLTAQANSAVKTVNGQAPDGTGNVNTTGGTVRTVNGNTPDGTGNVNTPQGTVKTVNTTGPDINGNVTLGSTTPQATATVQGTIQLNTDVLGTATAPVLANEANVPGHEHNRLFQPVAWLYTRNDGSTITLKAGRDNNPVIVLNSDTTINLDSPYRSTGIVATVGTQNKDFTRHFAYASNLDLILRDPYANFPTRDWSDSAYEMTLVLIQDDIGGHAVTFQATYNNGTKPGPNDQAASIALAGSSATTIPAPGSAAGAWTYYRFRWMGWAIGWMLISNASIQPRFRLLKSSASSGATPLFRAVDTNWIGYTTVNGTYQTEMFSGANLVPTPIRRMLYNLGFMFEANYYSSSYSYEGGDLGGAAGIANMSPRACWLNPATADSTTGGTQFVTLHEISHQIDALLYNQDVNGVSVTIPDTANYWWTPRKNAVYAGQDVQVSAAAGSTRTIWAIYNDPQIQQMWAASLAAYNAGGTTINAYYVFGQPGLSTAAPGPIREWMAEMMGGYMYWRATGSDAMMQLAAPATQIALFKQWFANNSFLQQYFAPDATLSGSIKFP